MIDAAILGSALGGIFRLGQAWLEARERQKDREHEFNMLQLNGDQAMKMGEQNMRLFGLAGDISLASQEIQAVQAVSQAQADEASKAGGFVAALSASVRPVVTYWLVLFYIVFKGCVVAAGWQSEGAVYAIMGAYGETDLALLSSVLTFWFVDRSIRRSRVHVPA